MMSYKTLRKIPGRYADVFPSKEKIASIFRSGRTYNCLHYASYDGESDLVKSLTDAISWGGIGMDALQLDMTWPEAGDIASVVHASQKTFEVILQVGKRALKEADNDPQVVVNTLEDYEGIIKRVLLDRSMGKGIGMKADYLAPFVRAIKERFPQFGISVAGGLGPETMHLVRPLVEEFPDISIDAQGKLRQSGSILDPIDWGIAEQYLINALSLF
ncbi:hypothetical protein COB55_04530 [Candidatus Wolfebacteria bacterium]|nr:MAG: hypothetical protein COB55_04530 [Candidatus Wolfebacteria bacterium]